MIKSKAEGAILPLFAWNVFFWRCALTFLRDRPILLKEERLCRREDVFVRFIKYRPLDESLTARFVLPVVLENTFTIFIGMVIAQVVSTISASALVAVGMANSVMSMAAALFTMVTVGSGILVARQVGAGEMKDAADTIEQSTFVGLFSAIAFTVLGIVCAGPMLQLLMPNAEDAMVQEAVRYFSVVILSLPLQVVRGVFGGVCRGLGDSRTPLVSAVSMNLCQLISAWVFVHAFGWDEMGVGLAYILCYFVGAGVQFYSLMRRKQVELCLRGMLRPRWGTCMRILRLGLPVSVQSIFSSLGATLASSMVVNVGAFESGVYQIVNTLGQFTSIPRMVCDVVMLASVGHLLGAKRYKDANKAGWLVFGATAGSGALMGLVMCCFAVPLCGLYSSDPATVQAAASLLWILLPVDLATGAMFAADGVLASGGDTTSVMVITLFSLWCVRLPLTYLVCFVWQWGALGVFLVYIVVNVIRVMLSGLRLRSGKWIHKKV